VPDVAVSGSIFPEPSSQTSCHCLGRALARRVHEDSRVGEIELTSAGDRFAARSPTSGTGEPRISRRSRSNFTPNRTPWCTYAKWPLGKYRA
jgi:hypothetical protein